MIGRWDTKIIEHLILIFFFTKFREQWCNIQLECDFMTGSCASVKSKFCLALGSTSTIFKSSRFVFQILRLAHIFSNQFASVLHLPNLCGMLRYTWEMTCDLTHMLVGTIRIGQKHFYTHTSKLEGFYVISRRQSNSSELCIICFTSVVAFYL